MGSFAALVLNLNVNLERLGSLNEIEIFVDTTRDENGETDEAAQQTEETPAIVLDSAAAEQTGMLLLEAEVNEFDNMSDLPSAYSSISELMAKLDAVTTKLDDLSDPEERARQQLYLNVIRARFDKAAQRITALNDIDRKIRGLDNVISVVFTSRAAGLDYIKKEFADYPSLFEYYTINNLPDKFIVSYNDNSKVSTLEFNLNHLDGKIYKVKCRTEIAQTMENLKHGIVLVFTWFMAILFIVSLFVIINTIKLAVFSRRQEISIMRYVGATNWFIVLPFIFEGIVIGLIASGLAYLCEYYIYTYVQNFILSSQFYTWMHLVLFSDIKKVILAGFVGIGIFTGIVGSSVSLRKYLKA